MPHEFALLTPFEVNYPSARAGAMPSRGGWTKDGRCRPESHPGDGCGRRAGPPFPSTSARDADLPGERPGTIAVWRGLRRPRAADCGTRVGRTDPRWLQRPASGRKKSRGTSGTASQFATRYHQLWQARARLPGRPRKRAAAVSLRPGLRLAAIPVQVLFGRANLALKAH